MQVIRHICGLWSLEAFKVLDAGDNDEDGFVDKDGSKDGTRDGTVVGTIIAVTVMHFELF